MKSSLLVFICALSINSYSHEVFLDHAWQIIPDGVTISLRNKLMDEPYDLEIKITNTSTGKSIEKIINSGPDDWNKITFPDDFEDSHKIYNFINDDSKDFYWIAKVEGRLIMSGKFTYPTVEYIWTKHE